MKMDPLLTKAAQLAKKRDYEGAIRILKAEEDRYYGSFKYYYLYAVICLHSGSFVEALTYFRHARQIKMKDPNVMLGLAVLYLKRMDTVQAVDYYLDVKEIEPQNKTAKKALAVIRKYSAAEDASKDLSDWLTPGRLAKLYPKIPAAALTSKAIINALLIFIAALGLSYILLVQFRVMPSPFKTRPARHSAEFVLSGQERSAPVEVGGSYSYILTRDQALDLYDKALALFTSYRDEAAKINLNRILESNASESLKNKSRLLLTYMEVPGFDNFNRSDNVTYENVRSEPVIYRDVYVIWRGMATNAEVTEEHTRFDFLIGYDTRRTLEGIVSVIFNMPVALNTERTLDVLGKIVLQEGGSFRLEGVAIYQSGRLEQ